MGDRGAKLLGCAIGCARCCIPVIKSLGYKNPSVPKVVISREVTGDILDNLLNNAVCIPESVVSPVPPAETLCANPSNVGDPK